MLSKISVMADNLTGAFSLRVDGSSYAKGSSENVKIIAKADLPGIDIRIKAGTKGEKIHIPVILTQTGIKDLVYNDFYIGDDCDVTIVAGCGIHNCGSEESSHDGIHSFHIGKNSRVIYLEKHYGEGGNGKNVMNPTTIVEIDEGGYMEMDTVQIQGVDNTIRTTKGKLADKATLKITERIMTDGEQYAETHFDVDLNGVDSGAHVISRSVARDKSRQLFISNVNGNNKCMGHTECDAIIMNEASVSAVPKISANSTDASLIHEAAIGKIAGDQLIKLMTLGLTEKEAEERIINGFIK
ncbi:MAG: SufD family Fe-S cluster assembly protein [Firmicutes bacterium]|nr:SufD family Fe-S cluster assembly protein [Bacillota bacterium]